MKGLDLKKIGGGGSLRELLEASLGTMEENFVALVERPVSMKILESGVLAREAFLQAVDETLPAMVGRVSKEYEGLITLLVNLADAATLSCLLRMVAPEVVEERRAGLQYGEEDREAFGEVGNILFSAVDEVFRKNLPKAVAFRLVNAVELEPGGDGAEIVPEGELFIARLEIKVGDFPEGDSYLVLSRSLAEALEGRSLDGEDSGGEGGGEAEEDFPDEMEGRLVVFGTTEVLGKLAREAAEKVGLQVDVRPPGEVPNPATLKDCLVLLEIPDEEEKYFQWCRRLKKADPGMPILAALEWPTKRNVLLAFKAGADQILGLPCTTTDLLRKVWKILKDRQEAAPEETPAPN